MCGHARGTLDEYILAAIENGMKEFGFSDHAPMPEHLRQGISMGPGEIEDYISAVLSMKEKYSGRIDVKLGLEVDYPLFDSFEKRYLVDPRIDYIIGSVHFIDDWAFDHPQFKYRFDERDIDSVYLDYYRVLGSLALSAMCDVIGHFDLVKKFGHRPVSDMNGEVEKIARVIARTGAVVEINTSGLIKPVAEIYPSDDIIAIFFRNNVPVTLGSDSHSPDEVCGGYPLAIEKLKAAGYRKVSGFTARRRHELDL